MGLAETPHCTPNRGCSAVHGDAGALTMVSALCSVQRTQATAIREVLHVRPCGGESSSHGQAAKETDGAEQPRDAAHMHYCRRLEGEMLGLFATAAHGSPEDQALLQCAKALAAGGVSVFRGPASSEGNAKHDLLLRYSIDASGHGYSGWLALLANELRVDIGNMPVPVGAGSPTGMPALLYALTRAADPVAAAEALMEFGVRPEEDIAEAAFAQGVGPEILEHVFDGREERSSRSASQGPSRSESGLESPASNAGHPLDADRTGYEQEQKPVSTLVSRPGSTGELSEFREVATGLTASGKPKPAPMPWAAIARAARDPVHTGLQQRPPPSTFALAPDAAAAAGMTGSRPLQAGQWVGHATEFRPSQYSVASDARAAAAAASISPAHRTGAELWERLRVETMSTRPASTTASAQRETQGAETHTEVSMAAASNARQAAMASAAKRPAIPMSRTRVVTPTPVSGAALGAQQRIGGLHPLLMKRYAAMLLARAGHPPLPSLGPGPQPRPTQRQEQPIGHTPSVVSSQGPESHEGQTDCESGDHASEGGAQGSSDQVFATAQEYESAGDQSTQLPVPDTSSHMPPDKDTTTSFSASTDPLAEMQAAMRVVQQVEAAAATLAAASDQGFDHSSQLDMRWPRRGAPELRREPHLEAFEYSLPSNPDERDAVPSCSLSLGSLINPAGVAPSLQADQQRLFRAMLGSPIRQVRPNVFAPHRRAASALGGSSASLRSITLPESSHFPEATQ